MSIQNYPKEESLERIYRLFRGDTLNQAPGSLTGQQFSSDEALSRLAQLLQGNIAGETAQLPSSISVNGGTELAANGHLVVDGIGGKDGYYAEVSDALQNLPFGKTLYILSPPTVDGNGRPIYNESGTDYGTITVPSEIRVKGIGEPNIILHANTIWSLDDAMIDGVRLTKGSGTAIRSRSSGDLFITNCVLSCTIDTVGGVSADIIIQGCRASNFIFNIDHAGTISIVGNAFRDSADINITGAITGTIRIENNSGIKSLVLNSSGPPIIYLNANTIGVAFTITQNPLYLIGSGNTFIGTVTCANAFDPNSLGNLFCNNSYFGGIPANLSVDGTTGNYG